MYRFAVICGVLVATSVARAAVVQMDLMVSGQKEIAIVDANENGTLGDADDCTFGAQIEMSGPLTVTTSQSSMASNRLRACMGPCNGYGMLDSSSAMATIFSCDWDSSSPGGPFVPACMEFGSSVPSSSSSSCSVTGMGASQGAMSGPLEIKAGRLFYPGFEFIIPEPGFGFLCNAGGLAVEISTISGRIVVTDITFKGDPPTHACVKVPFELDDGSKKLLDACVPLTMNGDIEYAAGSGDPFAVTPLTGLPSCGGRNAAPTASDLGMVALGLALLGMGAWMLGRRRGFSDSLPLL